MCQGCWTEYGAPTIDSPAIRETADLIKRLRAEFSEVGGDLHIIIDDWNLKDRHIRLLLAGDQ
jgi:hypothetical protein